MSQLLSSPTRRTGVQAARKPVPHWPLTWKWKITLASVVLVLVGGGWWWHSHRQPQLVELFAYQLSPAQMQECSQKLSELNIEHQANPDHNNLRVSPEERLTLLNQLSQEGLPREDGTPVTASLGAPRREILARQQAQLQQSLASSLRNMRGVRDAKVQLAIPEAGAFAESNRPTASVLLQLQEGFQLPRAQANGIAKFIAGAVPDLRSEDVTVVDQTGVDRHIRPEHSGVDSLQWELQEHIEIYLASKAQRLLDMAYGRGNALAVINAELDFSQFEVKNKDVGAPGQSDNLIITQKTDEKYHNKSSSAQADSDSPEGKDYQKVVSAERHSPDEHYTFQVYKLPRLNRITCSVLIEASSQKENALRMVRGAIGMDESRGDDISVSVVPLHRPSLQGIGPAPLSSAGPQNHSTLPMGLALMAGSVGAIWWVGKRKIRLREPQLKPQGFSGAQTHCDLILPKSGSRSPTDETQPQVMQQLEDLARHSPRQTASLLRSYLDTNPMP